MVNPPPLPYMGWGGTCSPASYASDMLQMGRQCSPPLCHQRQGQTSLGSWLQPVHRKRHKQEASRVAAGVLAALPEHVSRSSMQSEHKTSS
eukprot:988144-Pelagomonas_calceolata.AAC.2